MRALIYNWVQFDVAGEGGGVSVYLRQTIPALVERHGWQVTVPPAAPTMPSTDAAVIGGRATRSNISACQLRDRQSGEGGARLLQPHRRLPDDRTVASVLSP